MTKDPMFLSPAHLKRHQAQVTRDIQERAHKAGHLSVFPEDERQSAENKGSSRAAIAITKMIATRRTPNYISSEPTCEGQKDYFDKLKNVRDAIILGNYKDVTSGLALAGRYVLNRWEAHKVVPDKAGPIKSEEHVKAWHEAILALIQHVDDRVANEKKKVDHYLKNTKAEIEEKAVQDWKWKAVAVFRGKVHRAGNLEPLPGIKVDMEGMGFNMIEVNAFELEMQNLF